MVASYEQSGVLREDTYMTRRMVMESKKRPQWFLIGGPLIATFVAFVIRLYDLGGKELWYDEAISGFFVLHSWSDLILYSTQVVGAHPPFYYLLLKGWGYLAGSSSFSLRWPSLACGVIFIALLYRVVKRFVNWRVALGAAFLATLSPFLIIYSQETRMYSLVILLALCSLWSFMRAMESGSKLWWVLYVATTTIGLNTHGFMAFAVVAQNIGIAIHWRALRHRLATWLLVQGATWVLPSIWMVAFSGPRALLASAKSLEPWARPIPQYLITFQGLGIGHVSSFQDGLRMGLLALVPSCVVLLGLVAGWRGFLPTQTAVAALDAKWRYWLLVLCLMVPVVGVSAFPIWLDPRYFFAAMPAYLIFMALGLDRLRKSAIGLLALCVGLVLVSFGIGLNGYFRATKGNFGEVVAWMEDRLQATDVILLDNPDYWPLMGYYYHGPAPYYFIPTSGDSGTITESDVRQVLAQIGGIKNRIWLGPAGPWTADPDRLADAYLNTNYFPAVKEWFQLSSYASLYFRPLPLRPGSVRGVNFADQIELERVDWSGPEVATDDAIRLILYWKVQTSIAENYIVALKLIDENGAVWAQRHSVPCAESCPTTHWEPGQQVKDRHALWVPPDTPPGRYILTLDLWDPERQQSLPIISRGDGALDLGEVVVSPH